MIGTGPAAAAGSASSSSSTPLQIPPPLQVVDEEDSGDDLPEGFDMRPERPGGVRFNAAIFVPDIDWPAYKRRTEGRGAWSVEVLPDDLELLAVPDFAALQRLYAGGGAPLVPLSPAANAFFIRRLPPDQRGGRIPKMLACRPTRRWVVRRPVHKDAVRPIMLGVSNGRTGHECPADRDRLSHFAGR